MSGNNHTQGGFYAISILPHDLDGQELFHAISSFFTLFMELVSVVVYYLCVLRKGGSLKKKDPAKPADLTFPGGSYPGV